MPGSGIVGVVPSTNCMLYTKGCILFIDSIQSLTSHKRDHDDKCLLYGVTCF